MFNLRVFSPNHSCAPLRNIPFNNRILLRLGSTTPLISEHKYLELNSIEGVKISSNKIAMKETFDQASVCHSEWINSALPKVIKNFLTLHKIIIAKHKYSSKGNDIYYIDNSEFLEELLNKINIRDFVFEKYYFFPKEYRVHVDVNYGNFYTCKKVLKQEVDVQWHKHANNSIFVLCTPNDIMPNCWNNIIKDCQRILKIMNLTIACFDILCCDNSYIILESNTAPSLKNVGIMYYALHLKKYYENKL